jgi:hypothetical protein
VASAGTESVFAISEPFHELRVPVCVVNQT